MKDPVSKEAVGMKDTQTSRSGISCISNLIEGLDINVAVIFGICVRKKVIYKNKKQKI